MGMGKMEEESSTGRIWAAEFHHVMAHSSLNVLKFMNCFFNFPIFFGLW
jgi:hypothetical protein